MSDSNQPVSLGCGTLILIALIVLIFSNANDDEERQIRELRSDVQALTEEIREMHAILDAENANDVDAERSANEGQESHPNSTDTMTQ